MIFKNKLACHVIFGDLSIKWPPLDDITGLQFPNKMDFEVNPFIGESYESFVRKRTLVKYQSQSEVIKLML